MAPASTSSPYTWLRWLVFGLILGALGTGYVQLAEKDILSISERQLSPLETRHLSLAEATAEDLRPDFRESVSAPLKKLAPHRTDGLIQPLSPWLAAWMLDPDHPKESLAYITWFRTGLTASCLILLGLACMRFFALPATLLVVTLTGFHGWAETLSHFTGATLFQLFFLLTWLGCVYGLQRNSLWVYGAVGVFGGLAYLSQDRILPLLVTFILVTSLRAFWGWLSAHWRLGEGTTLWLRDNHLFGLILLVAAFCAVSGPRLTEAHQKFGDAAFQYVDHIRWLDTPAEGEAWIEAHPDRSSLKKVPALERPTARLYFQSHASEQVQGRLLSGLGRVMTQWQGHGGEALAVLLVLLIVTVLACWCSTPRACHAGERLHPETATAVIFVVAATAAYLIIAAWDSALVEIRYLHALTGPLALSLLWGYESVLRRARRRGAGPMLTGGYQAVLWVLLGATWFQIWQTHPEALPSLP
ncbi:hypothetical protein SAMN02745166_03355 [Prosthecobacter debontii]|uniref:Dolichyl-phosphate-mannose-protein mannosyltransferase n=1 Tax=Prosthecobacter debontii TaxID=48467 RepID=A0A1T4YHM4_9BACT|nr:hypothetical protein [Prosthecobacter debontii]SKB01279.1 hypothetical protein SAMN02745166_03355 [Prosthecobacter debontii]